MGCVPRCPEFAAEGSPVSVCFVYIHICVFFFPLYSGALKRTWRLCDPGCHASSSQEASQWATLAGCLLWTTRPLTLSLRRSTRNEPSLVLGRSSPIYSRTGPAVKHVTPACVAQGEVWVVCGGIGLYACRI